MSRGALFGKEGERRPVNGVLDGWSLVAVGADAADQVKTAEFGGNGRMPVQMILPLVGFGDDGVHLLPGLKIAIGVNFGTVNDV